MRFLFNITSTLFHPLFMVLIMFALLQVINPYLFGIGDTKTEGLIYISVVTMSILFPLLSVLLMKGLGLIQSIQMKTDKERVGPMIATAIFYLWLYVNIRSNNMVPQAFSFFVLGSTIALFIAFFINQFSRISLHTIGIGGLLMGLIFVRYNFSYEFFNLSLGNLGEYIIHVDLLIICCVIIAGLIGTARLYLQAHDKSQVYAGYMVGCFSQILAYNIFF